MSDPRVDVQLSVKVGTAALGRWFDLMFGPLGHPPLDPDVARWEDDGGPPAPDPISYTHTIRTEPPWTMATTTAAIDEDDHAPGWRRLEPFEKDTVGELYRCGDGGRWSVRRITGAEREIL